MIGFNFVEHAVLIALMIPGAALGARLGRILLANVNGRYYLTAFRLMLAILAVQLIGVDGFGQLLATEVE